LKAGRRKTTPQKRQRSVSPQPLAMSVDQVDQIIAARRAKVRRARAELMKRLEDEARRMMQGRQGLDYVPDESAELDLAGKIIAFYVDEVPGGEASFAELQELLQRSAIHPRLVMAVAKKLLIGLEDDEA
jgi:hypothetical protein